jgi:hypothetical protein
MILLSMTMTILAGTAHSDEAGCREVLKKCDLALHAQMDVNKTQNDIINQQIKLIATQKDELSGESIWRPIAIGGILVVSVETLILILTRK